MTISNYFLSGDFSDYENDIMPLGKNRRIRKNSILQDVNTSPHYSYYIKSGVAKLSLTNEQGAERTILFLGPGSIYPLIVSEGEQSMENYIELCAVTDLDVIRFSSTAIKPLMASNPEFSYTCINHYAKYTNLFMCRAFFHMNSDSLQTISSFIYMYNQNSNNDISLTQDQIGKILGISRVQVSRVLSTLRNDNIIKTQRNDITVIDMDKLKCLCAGVVE